MRAVALVLMLAMALAVVAVPMAEHRPANLLDVEEDADELDASSLVEESTDAEAEAGLSVGAVLHSALMRSIDDTLRRANPSLSDADRRAILSVLSVRNARMEAAVALEAGQFREDNAWTIVELLRRAMCFARAMRPADSFDAVIGDLFGLPGSSLDGTAGPRGRPQDFSAMGVDRTGAFILPGTPLREAIALVHAVMERDGNARELTHLLLRLFETVPSPLSVSSTFCPRSCVRLSSALLCFKGLGLEVR
jgi:hypothetical protein